MFHCQHALNRRECFLRQLCCFPTQRQVQHLYCKVGTGRKHAIVMSVACHARHPTIKILSAEMFVCIYAVTGKRKRQENFQSRKRQAATAVTGASNQATAAEVAQNLTMNGDPTAPLSTQLDQPVQSEAAAAVNAVGASPPPSTTQLTPQQTDLVAPNMQSQVQPQNDASLGAAADTINPASATAPTQSNDHAVGLSNGQGTRSGLQEPANGSRQAMPTPQRYVVSKPVNDARGHTGYLTFARRSVDD